MPVQTERVQYVIKASDRGGRNGLVAATNNLSIADWIARGRSLLSNNRGVVYTIHGPNSFTRRWRDGREFPL